MSKSRLQNFKDWLTIFKVFSAVALLVVLFLAIIYGILR